jgi:GH24 family phage-related lysozyme (muramidase)
MDEEEKRFSEDTQKKGASALADKAKDRGKQQVKKIVRNFVIAHLPVILMVISGAILTIILIAGFVKILNLFSASESNEAKQNLTSNIAINGELTDDQRMVIKIDSATGRYSFQHNYTDEELEEFDRILRINGMNTSNFTAFERLFIMQLHNGGLELDKYTEQELKSLVMFYRAEMATQGLDTRPASQMLDGDGNYIPIKFKDKGNGVVEGWEDNEFAGVVQLHRTRIDMDDDTKTVNTILTYKDYETEFKSYATSSDLQEALEYFSINEKGEAVIYTWSSIDNNDTGEVITLSEKTINYKSYMGTYGMPYEFLSSILMTVNKENNINADFCKEIAMLALESEIVLNIQEELTITDTTTTIQERTTTIVTSFITGVTSAPTTTPGPITVIHVVTKENTYKIEVVKADTWIALYEKKYGDMIIDGPKEEDVTPPPDQVVGPTTTPIISTAEGTEGEVLGAVSTTTTTSTSITKIVTKYLQGGEVDGYPVEHIYARDEDGNCEKFLAVLDKNKGNTNEKVYDKIINSFKTKKEWTYQALEKDEATVEYVDILKYLLHEYSSSIESEVKDISYIAKNYGRELSFQSFGGGNLIKNYIRNEEGGSRYINAGRGTYTIYASGGDVNKPTVGYGVDINHSGYKQQFLDAGYDISIGAEIPIEFVDTIEDEILEANISEIKRQTQGLNLKDYQIGALVSRAYNMGTVSAMSTNNAYSGAYSSVCTMNFVNSYNAYWSSEETERWHGKEMTNPYEHDLYKHYMEITKMSGGAPVLEARRKREWILFATGYDYFMGGYWSSGIAGKAEEIIQYMASFERDFDYLAANCGYKQGTTERATWRADNDRIGYVYTLGDHERIATIPPYL